MASILESYDALMKQELKFHESVVKAVQKAKQHPALIEKKVQLLERKKARFEQRRKALQDLIDAGETEKAKEQFQTDTGKDYVAIQPIFRKMNSPRRTLKQKLQKKIHELGGPVHPNILPKHIVNSKTKKVKDEFRYLVKMPIKGSK